MARCSDDLFCFSSGNVALSVLMTAASTLAAVVSKLVLLSLPVYFFFFFGGGGVDIWMEPFICHVIQMKCWV
jgi:predicted Na+-dependent transporter